jgi:hypothetical protein
MEYVAEKVITTSIMMNPNLNFSMNRMLSNTKDCHELNMCFMVIYTCVEMQMDQSGRFIMHHQWYHQILTTVPQKCNWPQ